MSTLAGLSALVDVLRQLDEGLNPIQLKLLLTVAKNPDLTQVQLQDKLGLNRATVSRYVSELSDYKAYKTPGHGLLISEENPQNRREKNVRLTAKGERFIQLMLQSLAQKE